jgi:hypothetical protein
MISKRFHARSAFLALLCLTFLLPATAHASAGAVHVFVGQKFLDEDEWEPIEEQVELGIDAAFGGDDWPVWINLGLFGSNEEEEISAVEEVEGTTTEFYVGVNKTWTGRRFHPYVAGGLAFVNTEVEFRDDVGSVQDEDSAVGLYLGGGGYWRLGSSFNLGAMIRFSMADADVFGDDFEDGGGTHLGLTVGFGWPKRRY